MTNKEREDLIREMDERAELYSKSAPAAKEFLVRIGVLSVDGELTENYQSLIFLREPSHDLDNQ